MNWLNQIAPHIAVKYAPNRYGAPSPFGPIKSFWEMLPPWTAPPWNSIGPSIQDNSPPVGQGSSWTPPMNQGSWIPPPSHGSN